jgi:hypothetical protein
MAQVAMDIYVSMAQLVSSPAVFSADVRSGVRFGQCAQFKCIHEVGTSTEKKKGEKTKKKKQKKKEKKIIFPPALARI